jgi:hypothetical protein
MSTPTAEVDEPDVLPAIFEHCLTVYRQMESEARVVILDEQTREAKMIWEGHLTKLFANLHLSVPYYTSVTRELKRMGCVAQKRRGGGNAPSQWFILTEPTEELFRAEDNLSTRNIASRKSSKMSMLEQQVKDMAKTVAKIASDYDTIITVLAEKEEGQQ